MHDVQNPANPAAGYGRIPETVPIRLSRGEFWLLGKAVFMKLPLWSVALPAGEPWPHTIEAAFNHPGHGLTRSELAQTLRRLALRGWIRIYRTDGEHVLETSLPASSRAIAAEFERPRDARFAGCYYCLTPAGGQVWEQFAGADWDRFVDDEDIYGDSICDRTLIAKDVKRVKRYLAAVSAEVDVVASSVRFDEIDDWRPAYWKPPTSGIRCTFQFSRRPIELRCGPKTYDFRRFWCQWIY